MFGLVLNSHFIFLLFEGDGKIKSHSQDFVEVWLLKVN